MATTTDLSTEVIDTRPDRTLFQTNDPVEVLERATRVAGAFKEMLAGSKMTLKIGKSEHVLIEGWQTIGSMLGVFAVGVEDSIEPLADGRGWKARCEARTLAGQIVGAAEAICSRDETNWANSPEFQICSMAQTRAASKALSGPLRWVVKLAGYETTPAEEIVSNSEPYGPAATTEQLNHAGEALLTLYGTGRDNESAAVLNAIIDRTGYMPRASALALSLAAKHQPAQADGQ